MVFETCTDNTEQNIVLMRITLFPKDASLIPESSFSRFL